MGRELSVAHYLRLWRFVVPIALLTITVTAQDTAPAIPPAPLASTPLAPTATAPASGSGELVAPRAGGGYLLGPLDTLNIHIVDMDEMGTTAYPIDLSGNINLPRVGRVHAAGLTLDQLQLVLTERLRDYLRDPIVNVTLAEYHSQPVSVLGAVNTPGVRQIQGNKTLFEVISEAGGLRTDAGNTIEITRRLINGPLPLSNAVTDPTGNFSVAQLNIRSVMSGKNPEQNISVKPNDVITVPRADLVYVIGSVKHPGGFPLQERANLSVLEALSLAEGLDKTAAATKSKILRNSNPPHQRVEIPINVKEILEGKDNDVPLLADDILFIPNSASKAASARALEVLIQTGTGILVFAHPF